MSRPRFVPSRHLSRLVPAGLAFCLLAAGTLGAGEPPEERQTLVCYISWFSPLGAFNGVRQWRGAQSQGYRYADRQAGGGNFPLPPAAALPAQPPVIGSPEYYELERQCARETQQQMKAAGFDVAGFDMLPMPDFDPQQPPSEKNCPLSRFKTFQLWLEEAQATGLKIALLPDVQNKSGDYPAGRVLTRAEWVKVLSGALDQAGAAPALWRIDQRSAIIHFGTDQYYERGACGPVKTASAPDYGWREVLGDLRRTHEFFFIADIRPHALTGTWDEFADGAHIFAPSAPTSFLTEYQRLCAEQFRHPLFWIVSPGYISTPGASHSAYTQPDFARIHETYLAALAAGAQYLYVLTWNDFNENTDIAPSAYKGNCLLKLFAYYNQWFKTGQRPAVEKDQIFLAYPVRIPQTVRHATPPAWERLARGGGTYSAPPYQPKVFYWANVKTRTVLQLGSGPSLILPKAGLWIGDLGLAAPGEIALTVNGQTSALPPIASVPEDGGLAGRLDYRYVDVAELLTGTPLPQ